MGYKYMTVCIKNFLKENILYYILKIYRTFLYPKTWQCYFVFTCNGILLNCSIIM